MERQLGLECARERLEDVEVDGAETAEPAGVVVALEDAALRGRGYGISPGAYVGGDGEAARDPGHGRELRTAELADVVEVEGG